MVSHFKAVVLAKQMLPKALGMIPHHQKVCFVAAAEQAKTVLEVSAAFSMEGSVFVREPFVLPLILGFGCFRAADKLVC